MSVWNKYGTISKDGLIEARFYLTEVHYESAYSIWMQDKPGDKRYLKGAIHVYDGEPCVYVDNAFIARLPKTWTQFVKQASDRVIQAAVQIVWREEHNAFRAIVDIDESASKPF